MKSASFNEPWNVLCKKRTRSFGQEHIDILGRSDSMSSLNSSVECALDPTASERIQDAHRLTQEYKEREGELLDDVDFYYFADNDATGVEARINSVRTVEGDIQTIVTRSPDAARRFLTHKKRTRGNLPGTNIGLALNNATVTPLGVLDAGGTGVAGTVLRDEIRKAIDASDELPNWLKTAIDLDARDETMPAMDLLFDHVDRLLVASDLNEVNRIITLVPLEGPSLSFLMGVLTITLPAADRLPDRSKFFSRLHRLCKAMGRDPVKLLDGLRSRSGADESGSLGNR